MFKKTVSNKLILIGCISMLLAACGGGSGDVQVAVTATAGAGGTISPASQRVNKGSMATLSVQPDTGYEVQSITGCGGRLEGTTYRTGAVNADCAISASFRLKPLSVSITQRPSVMAEHDTETVNIEISNAIHTTNAELTVTSISDGSGTLTVNKVSNSVFELQASETDREQVATLELVATDGYDSTRKATSSFSVTINNTSFTENLAIIKVLTTQRERFIHATDEKTLLAGLRDTALLADVSVNTNVNGSTLQNTGNDLDNAIAAIHMNDYLNGLVGDGPLLEAKAIAMTALEAHVSNYRTIINSYMEALSGALPSTVIAEDYVISPELNNASFFIGNPKFGSVVNGAWVFNDNVAYLTGLVNADCGL